MNSTTARNSFSSTGPDKAVPVELWSQADVFPTNGRGLTRGRSLVRGLPVQLAYAGIDAIGVCLTGLVLIWLRFNVSVPLGIRRQLFSWPAWHAYEGFFLLYAAFVVFGCASQHLYQTPRDRSVLDESLKVAKAVGLATMILVLFIFTSGYKDVSRLVVISSTILNLIILSGWRYLKRRLILYRTASGIGVSKVLIVGTGCMGKALGAWLHSNRQLGFSVCGYLDSDRSSDPSVLGTLGDLRKVALAEFVDEIFITLPSESDLVKRLALEAHELRLGLKIFPDIYDGLGWHAPLHMIGGFPVIDLHWQPIPGLGLAAKRFIDIFVSGAAIVLTSPLLLLLALWVCLDSPGPSIYAAQRIGLKGKTFTCYKFRSMVVDADGQKDKLRTVNEREGPFFKMKDDPRITRAGRLMRMTSLDELPQLWNVLRGDMSLVGPRPHPVDDYKLYSIEHLRRLDVSPGMTGLWQVTSRNDPSFETNMTLDLEYIENWSLGLDLRILLKTIPALLRAEGH